MKPKNPTPRGWPRVSVCVCYADPRAAIDWLQKAFGFELRLLVEGPGGRVEHSELEYGDGLIMVSGAGPEYESADKPWTRRFLSPRATEGRTTANFAVHVDDADAHCATARAAGAQILYEPKTTDYGGDYWSDRNYATVDPE